VSREHRDLIGRTKELEELRASAEALRFGCGVLHVVTGPLGIGKRRLLEHFKEIAKPYYSAWNSLRLEEIAPSQQGKILAAAIKTMASKSQLPCVMVLREAHCASPSAGAWLKGFAEEPPPHPVLIIVSVHANLAPVSLREGLLDLVTHGARHSVLEGLETSEMRQLLHRSLDGRSFQNTELFEDCLALANGNPRYLKELCDGLQHQQPTFNLPTAALQLEAKLALVSPALRATLRAASVLGPAFDFEPLPSLLRISRAAAALCIQELIDIGVVRSIANARTDRYAFAEPAWQYLLEQQLSPSYRKGLYRRILGYSRREHRSLPLTTLARYYEGAAQNREAYALLMAAGDADLLKNDAYSSISYFNRAVLQAVDSDQERLARMKLAQALCRFGQEARGIVEYERVIEGATGTDQGAVSEVRSEVAVARLKRGERVDLAISTSTSESDELAFRLRSRLVPLVGAVRGDCGDLASLPEPTNETPIWVVRWHAYASRAALLCGDVAKAEAELGIARSLAREGTDLEQVLLVLNVEAENARSLGRIARQLSSVREAYALTSQSNVSWAREGLGSDLVSALIEAGDLDAAAGVLPSLHDAPPSSSIARRFAQSVRLLISVLRNGTSGGDFERNAEDLEAIIEYGERIAISHAVTAFALAALHEGKAERAQAILHKGALQLHDSTDAWMLAITVAQFGSIQTLRHVHEILKTGPLSQIPFNDAVCVLYDSICSRRRHRRVERKRLTNATATFRGAGCGYLAEIAELVIGRRTNALSIFAGSSAGTLRPSREPAKSDPLTHRQREIVDLIGRGFSSRKIAELLGIAEGTVTAHVASIFRRAEVHSRLELLAQLQAKE
jgi:DNA-binding CsgD family transcriptional regulator